MSAARARVLVGCLLSAAMLLLAVGPIQPASARGQRPTPVGSDRFVANKPYRGDFPDPAILKVGRTYFAYGTTTSSLNLPVMSSTDLVRWKSRGEGLAKPAAWAQQRRVGKRSVATTWAPTVARFGKWYLHAYATPVRGTKTRKMCISVARSKHAWGGFVDRTRRPWVCPGNRGAIDPQFFTAPGGARYLLWKSEQTGGHKAQLWITPLSADGLRLLSPTRHLLTVQEPWEGGIIENPSMIGFRGRYYLFYSGGSYDDNSYATGYAVCRTPVGPCYRASSQPLLATGGRVSGPGGAVAFYDGAMRLRLGYAAWDYGRAGYPKTAACLRQNLGCPQRRLHVATLGASPDGSGALVVTSRG